MQINFLFNPKIFEKIALKLLYSYFYNNYKNFEKNIANSKYFIPMFKFLFIVFAFSCAFALDLEDTEVFTIKRDSNTPTFAIGNQKKFAVKLSSNPTTGFNWYLVNSDEAVKSNLLSFKNLDQNGTGDYVANLVDKRIVGGSGNTYFIMESSLSGNGEVELKFVYKRIWMSDDNEFKKSVIIKVGNE